MQERIIPEHENFKNAISECVKTSNDAGECAKNLLAAVEKNKDRNGLSLLEAKNRDLVAYMSELAFLMCHMSCGESIQGIRAVERSVYLRTVLERIRPIEQKMASQIEKLSSLAAGSIKKTAQSLHPRPELMKLDGPEEEESEESAAEDHVSKSNAKKYVPPKLVAVHYDEDEDAKQERKQEQSKRRAMQSSLIQELRAHYSEAPDEIMEERRDRKHQQADLEKQKYEEDYFVRLQVNKKERHKRKLESRQNIIDDLLQFGDYMAMDTAKEKAIGHAGPLKKRKFGKRKFEGKNRNVKGSKVSAL